MPPPEPLEVRARGRFRSSCCYEDADLIVIDKPAGLVVHPAAGHAHGTLVNALLFHCKDLSGIGGVLRPGIVHRLDKDTSGVMVATKTDRAHAALTAAFAAKSAARPGGLERTYLAITSPAPPREGGTLRTLVRPPSGASQEVLVEGRARQVGGHALADRRDSCTTRRSCGSASRPAARIRSASTRAITAGRSSAIRSTATSRATNALAEVAKQARPPGAARRDARVRSSGDRRAPRVRVAAARGSCSARSPRLR